MNQKELKSAIKNTKSVRVRVVTGLYVKPNKERTGGAWEVRYTINKKRSFMTLTEGRFPELSLADAKLLANNVLQMVKQGKDPLQKRIESSNKTIITVSDLFDNWYEGPRRKLKYADYPLRYFTNEVKPEIGRLRVEDVKAKHIQDLINKIMDSGRPSIPNKVLLLCKQLFKHATKLDCTDKNPAAAFDAIDAGGAGNSRSRILSTEEIKIIFSSFEENSHIFTRDNYIASILLLTLGVRKGELIAAKWSEFDFSKNSWSLPESRSKTNVAIKIPIASALLPLFEELKVRSCGSDYLFPSRRASKRRAYISDDTLNHALAKIFGKKVDGNKKPYPNILGNKGIEYFVIHDLRRSCRSLLAQLGVPDNIAERCLNHKIKGVEGVYNRYDYFDERQKALTALAELVIPLTKK
ncbi:tyrosine-type recombinase/integrase [Pseudoalteromonas sp. SM9913]|jgi:integrase/ribosomal protein L23|uniref:tyrosine-type recombinase/integrase n=1 Tax=Pseudoalteromonas sp. (strain SM9913) TaxID=234831 RepID=UPI0001EF8EF2|nr:site-specific integrase [Pseudoalteromonas sp. SM9913]ADT69752.1 phage integrase family protein [Pseudoalteromonas sp. SM9913]